MKIEIKNIIATFQRVIRACNGTTAQNVPQQMLYIVGICGSMAFLSLLIALVIITVSYLLVTLKEFYYERRS